MKNWVFIDEAGFNSFQKNFCGISANTQMGISTSILVEIYKKGVVSLSLRQPTPVVIKKKKRLGLHLSDAIEVKDQAFTRTKHQLKFLYDAMDVLDTQEFFPLLFSLNYSTHYLFT